ncbi:hypothetical protein PS15m_011908 [Mucor circinelloides]
MDLHLNNMDISQIATVLQQFQQQLTAVQEKVQHHDNLLARLDMLEKENEDLKKNLLDRDLVIKNLQSQLSVTGTTTPTPAPAKTAGISITTPDNTVTAPSYASAAKKGKSRPDPATATKRRLAAGRLFQTPASKGPQGYQYVYLGRSKKIQRFEVRSALRKSGVDLGRVLDICFSASEVIGILLHVQYVQEFTERMKACEAELVLNFDPLDPKHIADPKYADLSTTKREELIYEFTNARCLQTLAFLRPLNVSGVGKYVVTEGWICEEDLSQSVADAMACFAEKEPKKAGFLFKSRKTSSQDDDLSVASDMEQ